MAVWFNAPRKEPSAVRPSFDVAENVKVPDDWHEPMWRAPLHRAGYCVVSVLSEDGVMSEQQLMWPLRPLTSRPGADPVHER